MRHAIACSELAKPFRPAEHHARRVETALSESAPYLTKGRCLGLPGRHARRSLGVGVKGSLPSLSCFYYSDPNSPITTPSRCAIHPSLSKHILMYKSEICKVLGEKISFPAKGRWLAERDGRVSAKLELLFESVSQSQSKRKTPPSPQTGPPPLSRGGALISALMTQVRRYKYMYKDMLEKGGELKYTCNYPRGVPCRF